MPRRPRPLAGGIVYHVLNRSCGRLTLFSRDADYDAFESVLADALRRSSMRLLSYCIMPNHWHLVPWPTEDRQLSHMMHWLTMTHTQRWRHFRQLVGLGPLYQGRFRAFPVEEDTHFLTVCRYVERNPFRANLVTRAQHWRWSSLHTRLTNTGPLASLLTPWPVDAPEPFLDWVNDPQTPAEESAIRSRIKNGRPYGSPTWSHSTATLLGLSPTPRPRGRPAGIK